MEEVPKKFYVAYKISQNIVCVEIQKRRVRLFLKLSTSEIGQPPSNYRDVSKTGHVGTGDAEFSVESLEQLDAVKPYVEMAYEKVGG